METFLRNCLLAGFICLAAACSGGGGGDSAQGVEPGPPPPGGQLPPEPEVPAPSPSPYLEATQLRAAITDARIGENGRAVIRFQLADGDNIAITDLTADDVRFVLSKLRGSPLGNLTGTWQSYINSIEQAGSVGPGTEDKLQATFESAFGIFGELQNHGDGTYTYTYGTDVNALPQEILAQAEIEGLNLSYEPARPHRVAIQFDNAPGKANPYRDWVPATGQTDGVFGMFIAATDNCNACHDPLAIHGGGRIEVEYCVTCHNEGSTDANSGNTVDMKVMIHKIHMGRNLPSVQDGGEYAIWGYRDSKHDYSGLIYPQDIRNCVNCHVGTGTDPGDGRLTLTEQGDNWTEVPTRAACGSCHENVNFERHGGGNEDDSRCLGCHSDGGPAGNVADSHIIPIEAAREQFKASIIALRGGSPGSELLVDFKVANPQSGEDYDLKNDAPFTNDGAGLRMGIAWATSDYTNEGNGSEDANQVQVDALADSVDNGDGSFTVAVPVPAEASGSGAAMIDGHPSLDADGDGELDSIPLTNPVEFFSINEATGTAVARRQSVDLANCLDCHSTLVLHGNNRADSIDGCATCHNPRGTDRKVRDIAMNPPTDGKQEESIDFKTMVHGIHAAAMRENALQIVGFRGFNTHVYDTEHVHYPGNLSNCLACHNEDGYKLPLADSVLGTTVDTGDDRVNPQDDIVVTAATAVCSSCHDDNVATAHMETFGGNFGTTQHAIDNGDVVEECSVCHGDGRSSNVSTVHGLD